MTTTLRFEKDADLCADARYDDLLLHYLQGSQRTVESIDQLGNFLMGFGVLALGYLLHVQLAPATAQFAGGAHQGAALLTLGAWGLAVGLLLAFVYVYIFRVLAGRAVHAHEGREDTVGSLLELPETLEFSEFVRHQRTFGEFLRTNYRTADRRDPAALLYARWSYMRFLCLTKLKDMNRMRALLGMALACGVTFKVGLTYLAAATGA